MIDNPETHLTKDLARYCTTAGIEKRTADQYEKSIRCYGEFLARPATRGDLIADRVNSWLQHVAAIWTACTARNRKRGITPIWNWLASFGAVPYYNPRELRRIRVVHKPPEAWTINQVQQLLLGAADLDGTLVCGIRASDLMTAWVRVGYETGLRPSDLYGMRWCDIAGNRIRITQAKTKCVHTSIISDTTVAAVERLRPSGSSTVFVLRKGGIRRWELKLFDSAASHGFTRRPGQSCGTLRKTAATETARADGTDAASQLLGHRSGSAVTVKHYIDPDALCPTSPPQALLDALAQTSRHHDRGAHVAG